MDPKTRRRILLFGERLWLVGAIFGILCTVFFIATGDNDSALFFLGFFVLSGLFYLLRKQQRRRFDKSGNQKSDVRN